MNELAQRINEAVTEAVTASVAARQAEVTTLLDKLRADIDALQQALDLTGRGAARRAAGTGRRRRRKPVAAGSTQAA